MHDSKAIIPEYYKKVLTIRFIFYLKKKMSPLFIFKVCKYIYNNSNILLLLLRSQSHAQTSSPVLTRKSAVRRRDAVGPQSFSFKSTGYGQVSCLRVLCDGQD